MSLVLELTGDVFAEGFWLKSLSRASLHMSTNYSNDLEIGLRVDVQYNTEIEHWKPKLPI